MEDTGLPLGYLLAKGEQGAGKSTACRVISSLIDPRTSALEACRGGARRRGTPGWSVFYNLSHLLRDLADAACRLANRHVAA